MNMKIADVPNLTYSTIIHETWGTLTEFNYKIFRTTLMITIGTLHEKQMLQYQSVCSCGSLSVLPP